MSNYDGFRSNIFSTDISHDYITPLSLKYYHMKSHSNVTAIYMKTISKC